MTDFTSMKIGDRVWTFQFGWGVIERMDLADKYPVCVRVGEHRIESFTKDGKWVTDATNPGLFLNDFKVPPCAFIPPMTVDTKLLVRDIGDKYWKKRYFKKFCGKRVVCFEDGSTSFSTSGSETVWEEWKLA
jgi:hypothetical protein